MDLDTVTGGYAGRIRGFRRGAKLYLCSSFLSQLCLAAFSVVFNLYLRRLGYSLTFIGLCATMNLLGTAFSAIPAGVAGDRYGRKQSLIWAIGLSILSGAGLIFTAAIPGLVLAFSALKGAASTFKSTMQSPFLVENSHAEERVHLFSTAAAVNTLAGTFGNAYSGFAAVALAEFMGWQAAGDTRAYAWILACSLAFFVASAFPVFALDPDPPPAGARRQVNLKQTLAEPVVRQLALHNAMIGGGAGLVLPLFNNFMELKLAATADQIGVVMSGSRLLLTVATLLSPLVAARLGKVRGVVFTQAVSIPLLLVIAHAPSFPVVAVAFWVRSTLMNMSSPIQSTFSMELVHKDRRATTNGVMTLASNLCRALTATGAGFLMDKVSLAAPYYGTCLLYTIGSIYYYRCFRDWEAARAERA